MNALPRPALFALATLFFHSWGHAQDRDPALAEFFDRAYAESLALNPLVAESRGDRSRNREWPDLSDAADEVEAALLRAQRSELATFLARPDLGPADQLSLRLFAEQLDRAEEATKWRDYAYPVSQMRGFHASAATHLMNVHKVNSVDDAEAYLIRLQKLRPLFAQLETRLIERADEGIVVPDFILPRVLDACARIISGRPFDDSTEDSPLLADFRGKVEKLALPADETATLLRRAETALRTSVGPAYTSLIAVLEEQSRHANHDAGVWKFPRGDAYYAFQLRQQTTTDLSPEEIHQIGLDNVARIHEAMRGIMRQVGFEGSLSDFFEYTRSDPRFFLPDDAEGRQAYLDLARSYLEGMNAVVPGYFDLLPRAPIEVRAVEAFRERSAGKAFYQRAAPDGSRPGYFYANLRDLSLMPVYQLEALVYHEGIPGHHFQISLAQELEDIPTFQKHGRFTAFTEGWALYCEELARDMGFYQDPYSDFGRLAMELWRACRLVVDTGLHAQRWTREEAIAYLMENSPNPEGDCVDAIERYCVMPGQATTYLIGKLKLMQLRDLARSELGDRFSYPGFHRVVLGSGAVPLSILEENVRAWIATERR